MRDERRSKAELIAELAELRKRVSAFENGAARASRQAFPPPEQERTATDGQGGGQNPAEAQDETRLDIEERYRALFRRSKDALYVADLGGQFIDANDAALDLLGYSREDVPRLNFATLLGEDQLAVALADLQEVVSTGTQRRASEFALTRKDGSRIFVETMASVLSRNGQPYAVQGVAREITQRKQAEALLHDSRERLHLALESGHMGMWEWDIHTNSSIWSDMEYRLLGLPPGDGHVDTASFFRHVYPHDVAGLEAAIAKTLEQGDDFSHEFRVVRADGEVRWLIGKGRLIQGANPPSTRLIGVNYDITERKRMEETLRESEERLRLAHKATNDVVWDWDIVHDAQRWNEAGAAVFGWTDIVERPQTAAWWVERVHPDDRARVDAVFFAVVDNPVRNRWQDEYRFRRADGSYAEVMDRGYVLRDAKGKAVRMIGAMLDITERKRMEQTLRASEEKFFKAFHSSPDGIMITRISDGRIVEVNEGFCRLSGYAREEALAQSTVALNLWESREERERCVAALRANPSVHNMEFRFRTKSGALLDCLYAGELIQLSDQMHALSVVRDITELKRAQEALQQSERELKSIFRAAPVGIGVVVDRIIRVANDRLCEMTGYTPGELMGQKARLLYVSDDDYESVGREKYNQIHEKGTGSIETRWLRKDGTIIHIILSSTPIDPCDLARGVTFTALDISERKRSEEALRVTSERLALAERAAGAGAWDWHIDTGRLTWAEELYLLFGLDPAREEATFVTWRRVLHPEDVAVAEARITEAIEKHTALESEYRIIRPSGEVRWINALGDTVYGGDGRPQRMSGLCIDITERRRTQEALRESERLYHSLVENLPQAVFRKDREGRFTFVNGIFCRALDKSPAEVLGKRDQDFYPRELAASYRADDVQVMETGAALEKEESHQTPGGAPVVVSVVKTPLRDTSGNVTGVQGIFWDITERRQLEEQLRQSQKMEAVGQLAGGVAHDFNNLLFVISGYTDVAMDALEEGHRASRALTEVASAAQRATKLVGQLLAFSRRQIMRPEFLDLNEIIAQLVKMLERIIGEHIHLRFLPNHPLGTVRADRGMMEQVLVNLCVNARDAMSGGGLLTIETDTVFLDEAFCAANRWAAPNAYVLLTITDTGCGMDVETLAHVFEPFFTTKDKSKGTGLGLSTVYGIVRQHDGMVEAASEVGQGATFRIYLPTAAAPAVSQAPAGPELGAEGGTETILLAEDDPAVRSLASTILREAGYTVLEAQDGAHAIEVFKAHADRIQLLVLDVVMPRMGGRDAYACAQAMKPGVRALFSSGYSEDAIHEDFVLKEGMRLVQKPYRASQLLREIRRILDGR